MTSQERKVYQLEGRLVRMYFKGLKPRPIKIVKKRELLGVAAEPFLYVSDRIVRQPFSKQLEDTLKHELIHYELKDAGKEYYGHGKAFLKRAIELNIVGSYELQQCFSFEELEGIPTIRKRVKISLKEVQDELLRSIRNLFRLVLKLPDREKIRFYLQLRNLYVMWIAYKRAVERNKSTIEQVIWQRRRGPKGKSLEEWSRDFEGLKVRSERLQKQLDSRSENMQILKKIVSVEKKMKRIAQRVRADYNADLA